MAVAAQDVTDTRKNDREGRGARRWRAAFRRIQQQLLDLEQDSKALELVYPQVCVLCQCSATCGPLIVLPSALHCSTRHSLRTGDFKKWALHSRMHAFLCWPGFKCQTPTGAWIIVAHALPCNRNHLQLPGLALAGMSHLG